MNIEIGFNIIEKIKNEFNNKNKLFILTDDSIYSLYKENLENVFSDLNYFVYIIDKGERSKNPKTVFNIYDSLIENNFGRFDTIIAFGGGVVGDIGGFVASTYMRGLDYIQIPTTLLAQVDSSVGGKTGFDYRGYKNIIGTFKFPKKTLIDVKFLKTLEKDDIRSGLGEILKYGLIYDYNLFEEIYINKDKIFDKDLTLFEDYVRKAVEIKLTFVKEDREDFGIRRNLNFGHTIGHAIESVYKFERYKHGEAIILGMMYESYIGYKMDLIGKNYFKEIIKVLSTFIEPIRFNGDEVMNILDILKKDKKNTLDNINMILPIGKAKVKYFENINIDLIKESLVGEWLED